MSACRRPSYTVGSSRRATGTVNTSCTSSFDRAMKKLEEALDFLQRQEEKLWFWGVDRAEDMGFSAEFLKEAGLRLDRRTEFPRKATNVSLTPEREVPAFVLGPMRRGLAESVEMTRELSRSAAAGG